MNSRPIFDEFSIHFFCHSRTSTHLFLMQILFPVDSMQLACTVQIPRSIGGLEASAIYIDTQNKFRSERFIEMGLAAIERVSSLLNNSPHNLTISRLLSNLFIFACTRLQEVTKVILHELERLVIEKQPKLIVVDDVAFQFRNDLHANEEFEHFKRKSLLKISQKLKSLASNYDLCVSILEFKSWNLSDSLIERNQRFTQNNLTNLRIIFFSILPLSPGDLHQPSRMRPEQTAADS